MYSINIIYFYNIKTCIPIKNIFSIFYFVQSSLVYSFKTIPNWRFRLMLEGGGLKLKQEKICIYLTNVLNIFIPFSNFEITNNSKTFENHS